MEYLAELFTAGDVGEIERVLQKLAAMRAYMRNITLGSDRDDSIAASVGMTDQSMYEMYRLMAHRQVRRALRDPQGSRRAGPRARGARLLARFRRRTGHVRVGTVR